MIWFLAVAKRVFASRIGQGVLFALAVVAAIKVYGNIQWRAGYEAYRLEQLEAATKAERARIADETRLEALSDHDLCADYLGQLGVPVDACTELRRVPTERIEPGWDRRPGKSGPAGP